MIESYPYARRLRPDAFSIKVTLAGGDNAAGLGNTKHLLHGLPRLFNVREHLTTKGYIKSFICKGKGVDIARLERDVFDAGDPGRSFWIAEHVSICGQIQRIVWTENEGSVS